MKIVVPLKRVIDYRVRIRVKPDGSGVEQEHVKMGTNPFDEIALEEAVRMVEQGVAKEVVAVTIGNLLHHDILRAALARGATRAILIKSDEEFSPLTVAQTLKKIVEQEQSQLVLLGKQAIDSDNQQVGQMLAGLLNWPQATYASKIIINSTQATVDREVNEGIETIKITLPAVITADLRLNEPRYLNLPQIMQAKNKPIEEIEWSSLQIPSNKTVKTIKTFSPPARKPGIIVSDVETLVKKLHEEKKVI